jgi:bifunctional non-homologous end joining protein LigD
VNAGGGGQSKRTLRREVSPKVDPRKIKGARKAALPAQVRPQLATLVAAAPSGDEWQHEIKFDGYRMIACLARRGAKLISRSGNDWTAKFPTIVAALAEIAVGDALLDGEVVHEDPNGITSFSSLLADLSEGRTERIVYCVFDLLHLDGYSLMAAMLAERKRALAALLKPGAAKRIRYVEHTEGNGPAFSAKCCRLGLEGIVSKRRDAPYRPGRSWTWLKVKCAAREEFAVIGWTDPSGSRQGIGALLLGYYDTLGRLHYAGGVGTGFTRAMLRDLRRRLEKLTRKTAPTDDIAAAAPSRAHWVRPELVVEVRFTEWTHDGRVRHPVFLGLREDKRGHEVIIDPLPGVRLH